MQQTPELLRLLLDAGVEFVLIGGVAAIAHGSATFTQDCDIAAPFTEANFSRLLEALAPYHPRYALAGPKRPVTESAGELATYRNLYLLTDLGRLDILSEVQALGPYKDWADRAISLELYGRQCRIISLDDLITVKRHLGRDKDRLVERELLALRARKSPNDP
ncbi:nucleotidyltransferase [Pyxidicoccus xibeiensis]|uniref:nucleotidyltransferase n=1 Tax=Pyxidicoccus xibeiensis TaxID=2906759 RepID=UPI0020A80068|nr:nucleotidyltransferase [Pyxidicoccus xibeiensis]MCP3137008.1 nucleotidyltransferase [Pyxidicoccus xibeiensis]